jgi:hypothetical protein
MCGARSRRARPGDPSRRPGHHRARQASSRVPYRRCGWISARQLSGVEGITDVQPIRRARPEAEWRISVVRRHGQAL